MLQPPEWMLPLADHVAAQFAAADVMSPIGCHFTETDGVWEITVFASQTEIIGGPQDGGLRCSRFHLDIKHLAEIFDQIDSIYWQAHPLGYEDDLGPHVGVEGLYRGRRVWLRVPASAPKPFPPGRRATVQQQAWEDLW